MNGGTVLDVEQITKETIEAVAKSSNGILAATGIQGVDLGGQIALIPVNVPARNNTSAFPRVIAGEGSQTATWRALLNINSQQTDAAVGMDFAGSLAKFEEQNCFAPYRPLAKACRVTLDAVAVARNWADALAIGKLQTLNQLFIGQDMHIINSQAWPLKVPSAPTLVASETGGKIKKTVKVSVAVAARSGANYFTGTELSAGVFGSGSTEASSVTTVECKTEDTCSVTASVAATKGAVAYDWYVGLETGTLYYYTTTTTAQVTITAVPTEAEKLPKLPLLSAALPAISTTALAARTLKDTSYSATKWYNGLIASILGDYGATGPEQPGKGTASSGATFIDWGGNVISGSGSSIPLLDQINDEVWSSVQLSPTAYMVNSLQGDEISDLLLGSGIATTFLPPTDAAARTNLAGGGYIGSYVNKAVGGVQVPIEVHPHVAPGTIIARTDRVPFPGSNIGSVFEVRCQYDTMEFQYAANYNPGVEGGGPRYDSEIRSMETLINRAPVAQTVVSNVK
jgi:hypothetical protein